MNGLLYVWFLYPYACGQAELRVLCVEVQPVARASRLMSTHAIATRVRYCFILIFNELVDENLDVLASLTRYARAQPALSAVACVVGLFGCRALDSITRLCAIVCYERPPACE